MRRPGNNQPCPCGSGKKYKKCCLGKDQREAYRCHFCGASEDDVDGETVVLTSGEDDKTETPGWACKPCIEKRSDKERGESFLPLMVALAANGGFGRRRLP